MNKQIKQKGNTLSLSKGFTIIELIVVIAIIAVLAAIVLVNVTQYIAKGKDSSIKGNMSSMSTIAAAYFDNHTSSFTGLDTEPAFAAGVAAIDDANGAGTTTVHIESSAWCITSPLNAGGTWCVDSTGFKGALLSGSCDAGADTHGYSCN